MNITVLPPNPQSVDTEIADCLQETQWVVENVTRDLREHAELRIVQTLSRVGCLHEHHADLLDQAWRQLKWQLRLNRLPNPT